MLVLQEFMMDSDYYKKLDDTPLISNEDTETKTLNVQQTMPIIAEQKTKPRLKLYSGLMCLTVAEFATALIVFIFGIACTAMNYATAKYSRHDRPEASCCEFGTAIWVGIIGAVCGALGLTAFRVKQGRKGFTVAYFVFCIMCAVVDGVLIVFSAVWLTINSVYSTYTYYNPTAALALNSVLLICSFAHMMLCIISSAFVCYNWNCCCSKQTVVVVYSAKDDTRDLPDNVEIITKSLIRDDKNVQYVHY